MWILLLGLLILGFLSLIIGYFRLRRQRNSPESTSSEEAAQTPTVDVECCGQHATCERDSLLAAVSKKVEYYDDEELDRFSGKRSDVYTNEEVVEFLEILHTMQEDDVAGWVRSLQLREVELPEEVKEEVLLIIGERRLASTHLPINE